MPIVAIDAEHQAKLAAAATASAPKPVKAKPQTKRKKDVIGPRHAERQILTHPAWRSQSSPLQANYGPAKSGGDANDEGEESAEAQLSAALVEDLTAQRTAAMRAVLATRPDVALVAAAHALALQVCYETPCYNVGSSLSLASEKGGCRFESHAKGIETSIAHTRSSDPFSMAEAYPG